MYAYSINKKKLVFLHQTGTLTQGLRASSLQFISPLEFNAIFRDGFSLRRELIAGSKIRDPVPAKFKLVRYYVVITSRTCRH